MIVITTGFWGNLIKRVVVIESYLLIGAKHYSKSFHAAANRVNCKH